jgi:hypothetical protein
VINKEEVNDEIVIAVSFLYFNIRVAVDIYTYIHTFLHLVSNVFNKKLSVHENTFRKQKKQTKFGNFLLDTLSWFSQTKHLCSVFRDHHLEIITNKQTNS